MGRTLHYLDKKMELFMEDEGITDQAAQARKICQGIGDEQLRRLNVRGLTAEQKKTQTSYGSFFKPSLKQK